MYLDVSLTDIRYTEKFCVANKDTCVNEEAIPWHKSLKRKSCIMRVKHAKNAKSAHFFRYLRKNYVKPVTDAHNPLQSSLSVELVLFRKPASQQFFRHCANLQHLNLSPPLLAYGVCLIMRLVHRCATSNICHDDLQLTWAIDNPYDHRKGLGPSSLGLHPVVLSFQWFASVGLPASNLNYLSCWLQRERAISFLLWIFLNCEFFLPSQL